MFGALKSGFRSLATVKLVVNRMIKIPVVNLYTTALQGLLSLYSAMI